MADFVGMQRQGELRWALPSAIHVQLGESSMVRRIGMCGHTDVITELAQSISCAGASLAIRSRFFIASESYA